jgi:hypothetical protein
LRQQFGGQFAGAQRAGAEAGASGILGASQVRAGRVGQIAGAAAFGPLGLLSDKRVKTDISDLNPEDCYNAVMEMDLKVWRYLPDVGLGNDLHIGVMAQDAPDIIRAGEIDGVEILNLHDELNLIAGALQHLRRLH